MKGKILLLTLLMFGVVFNIGLVMAPLCPPVMISKEPYCWSGAGYSDNPPYYVGHKYYWWIKITVKANVALTGVTVYDNLGAELMIEGICKTPKYNPYDWDFSYSPYALNGGVVVSGLNSKSGKLNSDGIDFGSQPYMFDIYWTGQSVKVHFKWYIGSMSAGSTKTIYLVVSTDTNPSGKQEYTSPGCYALNSGATVKARYNGAQVSATASSIWINVKSD